ncbi:MAG: DUF4399 domain-containing protein [Gemmatimonadaceae bacterium]
MKREMGMTLLVLAMACAEKKAGDADSAVVAPSMTAPPAEVTIVSPAEGDTTPADVTVLLRSSGVSIEKASGTQADGVGHYHFFVDTVATVEGALIPPTTSRTIHIGTGDSTYTIKGLTPGPHEVIALIGFGDHIAMPSTRDTVHFVVKK